MKHVKVVKLKVKAEIQTTEILALGEAYKSSEAEVKAEIYMIEILALGEACKSSEAEGKGRNPNDRDPCIR